LLVGGALIALVGLLLGLNVGGLRDPLLTKPLPGLKQHALIANPSENAAIWRAISGNWRTRVGGGEGELLKVLRTVRVVEPAVVDCQLGRLGLAAG
jgi:hypothetical protein